ncbi:MAG: hypothetical protein KKH34_04685 [Candidatus Omnitrophica bacterium]|nr:hypothetical protein [Candidatus Omnitrophota bacterium]MCG2705632.1 hypothetical protein [Candidatus Omnitrophota bacterium]
MAKKNLERVSFERETRVLLEEMNGRIKTIAEQHGDTVNRFDMVDGRLDKIDETLQRHDAKLYKLEWGLEGIKSKVGTMDIKLDRIERELETVKVAVLDTSSKVIDHEHRLQKFESGH